MSSLSSIAKISLRVCALEVAQADEAISCKGSITMSFSTDNDAPNPFNVFIILSVIVVVVVMIGLGVLIAISLASSSNNAVSRENGPYNVSLRPIPQVTQAKDVLPESIGEFKRDNLTGTIKQFKATYKKGDQAIEIEGAQLINFRAAQANVTDVANTVGSGNTPYRKLNADPSYLLTVGTGAIRYAWSHERWFFDIKANSQTALDEFMKVFKY
jgi:hypothetical protein